MRWPLVFALLFSFKAMAQAVPVRFFIDQLECLEPGESGRGDEPYSIVSAWIPNAPAPVAHGCFDTLLWGFMQTGSIVNFVDPYTFTPPCPTIFQDNRLHYGQTILANVTLLESDQDDHGGGKVRDVFLADVRGAANPYRQKYNEWFQRTSGDRTELGTLENAISYWFKTRAREIIDTAQYGVFDKDDIIGSNTLAVHYDKALQFFMKPGNNEMPGTAALSGSEGRYRLKYRLALVSSMPQVVNRITNARVVEKTDHHVTFEFTYDYNGANGWQPNDLTFVADLMGPPPPIAADSPYLKSQVVEPTMTDVLGRNEIKLGSGVAGAKRVTFSYQGWSGRVFNSLALKMKGKNGLTIETEEVVGPFSFQPLASVTAINRVTKGSADLQVNLTGYQSSEKSGNLVLKATIYNASGSLPPVGTPWFTNSQTNLTAGTRNYNLGFGFRNGVPANGTYKLRLEAVDPADNKVYYKEDKEIRF